MVYSDGTLQERLEQLRDKLRQKKGGAEERIGGLRNLVTEPALEQTTESALPRNLREALNHLRQNHIRGGDTYSQSEVSGFTPGNLPSPGKSTQRDIP